MNLQKEIDTRRAEIRTDFLSLSIGEWISLYENKEVDIHPEFQRIYRWDEYQKTRLIESILLGIPIPPIFVSQRQDGVWDVVDGLQRLSTIFQLVGILKNEKEEVEPPLVLKATDELPSLNGLIWDKDILDTQNTLLPDEEPKTLTPAQRLLIKRTRLNVSIILKESDDRSKYDLFQRLNTGGSNLSSQELRNCILVSINNNLYEWLRKLSRDENFVNCTNLTDKAINEQYDVELVLRFIVFRDMNILDLKNIHDLDEFITKKMRQIAEAKEFDTEKEGTYFQRTFELLADTTRGDSFRKYDSTKKRCIGGFLVSAYEIIALGIGYNIDLLDKHPVDIEEKVKQVWQLPEFIESSGSGRSASSRIPKVIPLGRRYFKP